MRRFARVTASHALQRSRVATSALFKPARFMSTQISVAQVKSLRDKTGAPIGECREALTAAQSQLKAGESLEEKAVEFLRKKGVSTASKKSGRTTAQGLVGVRVSADGKSASVVEVNSETDFVSRNEHFHKVVANIAQAVQSQPAGAGGAIDAAALGSVAYPAGSTVAEAVTQLVATVRENCQARRGSVLRAQSAGGVVGSYVHGAIDTPDKGAKAADGVFVGMGRLTAAVALDAGKAESRDALKPFADKLAMHIVAANPQYLTRDQVPAEVVAKEKAVVTEQAAAKAKDPKVAEKQIQGRLNKFFEEIVLVDQLFVISDPDKPGKPQPVKTLLEALGKQLDDTVTIAGYTRYAVGEGVAADKNKVSFAEEVAQKMKV